MIARWEQGRAEVDALLANGHLDKVPPNADLSRSYVAQAKAHLQLSTQGTEDDPVGAFQLAYDSSRKALASLLVTQGLRPTSRGGHIAVQDAVAAQFGTALGMVVRNFVWMRRIRNSSEYPSAHEPVASFEEARQAQEYARLTIEAVEKLIDKIPAH